MRAKYVWIGLTLILIGVFLPACGESSQPVVPTQETVNPMAARTSTPSLEPTLTMTTTPTTDPKITLNPTINLTGDERDLIAFQVFDDAEDTVTILLVQPDGSNLTKLVTLPGRLLGRGYSWSPDGRKIAFSHTLHVEYLSSDYFQIFTIDIYSGEIYQLTNGNENHRFPVWSPDGSRIAFFSGEDYLLSNVHADGGNIKVISEDPRVSAEYSWSPDGTRIAYEIVDGYLNASIWLMDANGKNARQFETEYLDLDTEYNYAGSPVWMPDGDHLVYLKQHDLYYGDIEGEFSTRLTFTLDYPELWFDVSPDGSMIAFIDYDGTYVYLKIIDLQGKVISEEKIGDSFEVDFDWSADSQAVVLTVEDQLWLYFVDDQSLLKLLDCPGKCRNPQWQP